MGEWIDQLDELPDLLVH